MISMESAMNMLPQTVDNSYKMTEEDVKRLIEFRASNEALFTGKRNSAKIAWNTILKGLGLQGKLTADQIAKKWDNLRTKYKDLKQPYHNHESGGSSDSWPWFSIMDEAMQGRLYNSNLVLNPDAVNNLTNALAASCHHGNGQSASNESAENADILEFLIKTEMEDTVGAEAVGDGRRAIPGNTPQQGVPMGWRRISECTYKMTEQETERMIKLRAANEALFTGRKHSAKPAWRAILYELGLQGKVTTEQLAKKWDNLKRRYKELKFPSRGSESSPSSWPWYYRMNDAMEGRFATSAPLLTPIIEDGDEEFEPSSSSSPPPPPPRKRARRRSSVGRGGSSGMAEFLTESEIDLLVDNEDKNGSSALGELHRMADGYTYKLTEEDTRSLIELRAANESLFTGRRNTAKPAWRGIVKQMELTGKITPDQVAKKWDNLKTKYKDLRFPPRGMENQTNPASWPWFQLMSDAMEGRLAGKAPRVTPIWTNEEENVFGSSPTPGERDCLLVERSSMSELEESLGDTEADGVVTFIDASGEECSTPTDCSYKMTDQDTRRLIKLRAANEALFTGRRNAAKAAWKAILKELGLLGKVSTFQMSKKWDNLKRRYKDLKYPPVGMENMADSAASWPWFHLMNDAMEGRLSSSGPLLTPITQDGDSADSAPRHRSSRPNSNQERVSHQPHPTSSSSDYEGSNPPSYADAGGVNNECQRRGGGGMEVEEDRGMEMEREWEVLERERAAVERDRAAVQAERLWLERERAALERDRAMLEEERASLSRDREILENQRAMILNSVAHTGHLTNLGM